MLLVSEIDEKRAVLSRLIIDGKTGKLKEEQQIAELSKYNLASRYAMIYGGVPALIFMYEKITTAKITRWRC